MMRRDRSAHTEEHPADRYAPRQRARPIEIRAWGGGPYSNPILHRQNTTVTVPSLQNLYRIGRRRKTVRANDMANRRNASSGAA